MSKDKVTLYMETTKKEPEETGSEIQLLLRKHKLKQFLFEYDGNGEMSGVFFSVIVGEKNIPYRLPVNHRPLWEMAQQGKTKYIRTEEQAKRVAWRQTYQWIRAQLSLIMISMVEFEEVFLPYMLVDNNKTVFDKYLGDGLKALRSRNE